jgi:GT2 family glycosyltransferase
MSIPKILHQLWIGPKPRPSKFMDTWRANNPDYEYIMWNEQEIQNRGLQLECVSRINSMSEINGKADIIRWEILYKYGGIFIDADCVCIEPLKNDFETLEGFSNYENEEARPGLIAVGMMGFRPKHPFCRDAIDWIQANNISVEQTKQRAWITVGPGLFTRIYNTGKYPNIVIFPSYYSLPHHYTGRKYKGHGKIYAHHEWGSTHQNYEAMNGMVLPEDLQTPKRWVSILVTSYNTKAVYIAECLDSIRSQEGYFGMEIVWINDGSTDVNSQVLERILNKFENACRFCKVVYRRMAENRGQGACSNDGVLLCSHEIVFRMDSDDIMMPNRIQTELDFFDRHPDATLIGSNVQMFHTNENNEKIMRGPTSLPASITWEEYKRSKSHWIMAHPAICFKRSAVLEIGSYNNTQMCEDLEMELKVLKRFGKIYNIQECLVQYRIHPEQVTFQGKSSTPYWINYRNQMIEDIIRG